MIVEDDGMEHKRKQDNGMEYKRKLKISTSLTQMKNLKQMII